VDVDLIKKLYFKDKLSCSEIGKKLNLSVWQIIGLMKKYNLKRRTSAETNNIKFNQKPLSFLIKNALTEKEKLLQNAGLMLYFGEGTKFEGGVVDLANSNEKILLIFLKMLRKIYHVEEKRLRVLLYCYANQNINKLINYWSNKTNITKSQFVKPYIRQDYKPEKIDKMPHGLIHIRYNDKRLFMTIMEQIGIISEELIKQG
jgi:hypothetical protein